MADPVYRLVCRPAALAGAPADWARETLADGELALLPSDGGLSEVSEVAHALALTSVRLVRVEADEETQQATVIAFADGRALVWIGGPFSERTRAWARDRGPMTLLLDAGGALDEDARRRVQRFVAALGRQSE